MTMIQQLRSQGFDLSEYRPTTQTLDVRCSQCEALVINGMPTHEAGCIHIQYDIVIPRHFVRDEEAES